ncbi:MAG: hypothetical protein ABJR05_04545 [Balneola sp.]
MKKLIISLPIFLLIFATPINTYAQADCTTECRHYATGCDVTFRQTIISWSFTMTCDDGFHGDDFGSGQYTSTICGGVTPCSVQTSL